ncbi:hypothetical protein [Flavobacterium collinsii]|uniref:Uncharacterized protein n=1 Tax=Flavobacterium collinsii TaxID=1114861 RepID=A0ABM8KDF6_9FLAO|nr:hypothetical protein [Flavobacterium collinsii]CAA9194775.1 hypothetical protein FLACOL7796_00294 [Flavobacterium collinsii]
MKKEPNNKTPKTKQNQGIAKAKRKTPVTFLNGFSSRRGALALLAVPHGLKPRTEFCRAYTCVDGNWGRADLYYVGKSLTSLIDPLRNYRALWTLGRNGEVTELIGANRRDERIPNAGLGIVGGRGYVNTLKNIAGQLYVCGYQRQVYVRRNEQWLSLADEILSNENGIGFLDIDGLAYDQIYAVGWKGEIYFYDGKHWHCGESPTTAILSSVRCLPDGEVWICGYRGLVMHGAFNRWTVLEVSDPSVNWYCLEEHEGEIYLAGNGVLAKVDGDKLVALDPIGRPITTHRLHSRDGVLWSIGESDILFLEDGAWHEVIHPDNA